jgi:hypothetical protein
MMIHRMNTYAFLFTSYGRVQSVFFDSKKFWRRYLKAYRRHVNLHHRARLLAVRTGDCLIE